MLPRKREATQKEKESKEVITRQRKLTVDNNCCKMSENATTMTKSDGSKQQQQVYNKENANNISSTPKPHQNVEEAEDSGLLTWQHERHILFHFFTLFSISFIVGVLIIHLSLWINANYLSSVTTHNDVIIHNNNHVMTSSAPPNYHDDDDVTHDDVVSSGGELNLWFEPIRLTPSLYDVIIGDGVVKAVVNAWNMTSSSRMM